MDYEKSEPTGAIEERHFIKNMKRVREERGMAKADLAKAMVALGWENFHPTTISRIESGERAVRLGEARGISAALGVYVGQMILPSEVHRPLYRLLDEVADFRTAKLNLGDAGVRFYDERFLLASILSEAEDVDLPENAEDWLENQLKGAMAYARRAVKLGHNEVVNEAMEANEGLKDSLNTDFREWVESATSKRTDGDPSDG